MKQRIKNISTLVMYAVVGIMIIVATILLVLIGKGYIFDLRTGEVSGGGLILIKSEPVSASIAVDNKTIGVTPKRLAEKAGRYQLKLTRAGYRTWQKSVVVEPGAVSWVQYPFLIPNELKQNVVAELEAPASLSQSVDAKYVAIAQNSANPHVDVVESSKKDLRTIFTLPAAEAAAQGKIKSVVWSTDNDHVLIRTEVGGQSVFFTASATSSGDLHNLNAEFGLPLDNLTFSAGNWRVIYWQSPQGLRILDVGNKTISGVLAADVQSYIVTKEAVFFVSRKNGKNRVSRLDRDNTEKILIEDLEPHILSLGFVDYGGKRFLVLQDSTTRRVSLYPSTTEKGKALTTFSNVESGEISISPNMHYLVMHGDLNFATYDFEFSKLYRFSLGLNKMTNLTWFDQYHLLGQSNGSSELFEFDGGNPEAIAPSSSDFPSFASNNHELIYSIGTSPTNGKTVLNSTKLVK